MKFKFPSNVLRREPFPSRSARNRLVVFLLFSPFVLFSGCASFVSGADWTAGEKENAKGSVRIISVSAERPGDWGSLEKETKTLFPLFLSEENYFTVSSSDKADYSADVTVREREYPSGWRTRRSLSCEVRIWSGDTDGSDPLPLAAGRSLIQGKHTLASSKILNALLKKAVKRAVRSLPKVKNDSPDFGAE